MSSAVQLASVKRERVHYEGRQQPAGSSSSFMGSPLTPLSFPVFRPLPPLLASAWENSVQKQWEMAK